MIKPALSYRERSGNGTTYVFVHGNSQSSETFAALFEGWKGTERLLAVDLPGHGNSPPRAENERYSLGFHAAALASFVRERNVPAGTLYVGHSLGGDVLLQAIDRLPAPRGIVLYGTAPIARATDRMLSGFFPEPSFSQLFAGEVDEQKFAELNALYFAPGFLAPAFVAEAFRRTDPRARTELGESVAALEFRDEIEILESGTFPIACFQGSADRIVRFEFLDDLFSRPNVRSRIESAGVRTFAGVGHHLHLESPVEFREALRAYGEGR